MLSAAEFDRLVEAALPHIPKRFRRCLGNVASIVEQEPPRPGLLGLYQGHPLTRRPIFQGFTMPDRIMIYQGPQERMSRTPPELKKMVADTIWHEIATYFGMDEPHVRRAERNIAKLRN